ncbi:MAG: hypothetical protein FJ388_15615, partial [Verrucomicrobia bacterium]|nr:hypothetical protein [Verrucomicrobiota bacterium]
MVLFGFACAHAAQSPSFLLPTNLDAPFCYVHGGARRWPILSQRLPDGVAIELTARAADKVLGRGPALELAGLRVSLSRDGWLEIVSDRSVKPLAFELEVAVGKTESQRLTVRAAPPPRPISYVADFIDDLIHIFMDRGTGQWRPIEKGGLDQHFRRLQAHGISRLIFRQSPFPWINDPKNYAAEDWRRHTEQTRAIVESEALNAALEKHRGYVEWAWIRQKLALALTPAFGEMLTRSAAQHGIRLSASFRPFEPALSKYYWVPAFDCSGDFLWNFHPNASPAVSSRPETVCFAHYRVILSAMGRGAAATLNTIRIASPANAGAFLKRFAARRDNLRIVATGFPPMQSDSFVLVRNEQGRFQLRPFAEIQPLAEARRRELTGFRVAQGADGSVEIASLKVPAQSRFLILSNPAGAEEALDFPAAQPVTLWSRAGKPLGRENVWWATADPKTRVGSITATGAAYSDFFASEASGDLCWRGPPRRPLRDDQLVIDLGSPWSAEMVDFNQPAARRYVVNELRTILNHPPFDEIYISTRSHTQLAAYLGDGEDGIQPRPSYRAAKKPHIHLGVDRAYAPRTAAKLKLLRDCPVEKITTWQPGEWDGTCQQPDGPYPWRYARNREVANGVRSLLQDLERAFPTTRIRAVLPERAAATEKIKAALDQMPKPGGGVYGRDYYRQIWASINHIPAIGEGMAMVDLRGLRVEPVFLGIRSLPETEPFKLFVRECIADMADNHGSSFRGPRSFFYEGHETLRTTDRNAGRRGREEIIRHLLSQRG